MGNALNTLIELAQGRMDDAAKRLGQALASSRAHEERLQLLVEYREEYRARFRSASQNGITPDAWRNFSVFLNRLDEAIIEQENTVERGRAQVAQGRQSWVDERNRKRAFDTLAERQHREQMRKESQMEQRQTDEHSAKLFRPSDDSDQAS